MILLSLLRSKKRCIENFLEVSKEFSMNFDQDDVDGVIQFQQRRDTILKAIDLYDRKISEEVGSLSQDDKTDEFIEKVRMTSEAIDEVIAKVRIENELIVGLVEQQKEHILTEMRKSQTDRERIGRFKSGGQSRSGRELDEKL